MPLRPGYTRDYYDILQALGPNSVILPLGDPERAPMYSPIGESTFLTKSYPGLVDKLFTWSEVLAGFATIPGRQGSVPVITFNGTDEEADTPDAAFWTRALAKFSVGAWVRLTDATSSAILAKYTTATDRREWVFWLDAADKLQLIIYDEDDVATPNASIDSEADTALTQDVWVFVVATYDGTADASGINLYQDGVLVASTDTDDPNFASMRDTAAVVELAMADGASFFDGVIAGGPLGPFFTHQELTLAQIAEIYSIGKELLFTLTGQV